MISQTALDAIQNNVQMKNIAGLVYSRNSDFRNDVLLISPENYQFSILFQPL